MQNHLTEKIWNKKIVWTRIFRQEISFDKYFWSRGNIKFVLTNFWQGALLQTTALHCFCCFWWWCSRLWMMMLMISTDFIFKKLENKNIWFELLLQWKVSIDKNKMKNKIKWKRKCVTELYRLFVLDFNYWKISPESNEE